ncbi:MAG: hypothetical protein J5910_10125 [Lachnospiraceae bacterium]|nr:hypothetical protein [Lachnospiraceae bacterium]
MPSGPMRQSLRKLMGSNKARKKHRVGVVRRRRRRIIILIFALLFVLCTLIVMIAAASLPVTTVSLSDLSRVEFSGFNSDGFATAFTDDAAVDELLSRVKKDHEKSWLDAADIEDADYAKFRQSLSFSVTRSTGLSNGDTINVVGRCDEKLAKKLKLDIKDSTGTFTVEGLADAKTVTLDEVFEGLEVSYEGISPGITVSLQNTSRHPLIGKMTFVLEDPKRSYANGDTLSVRAQFTEEMCMESGFSVEVPSEQCVREYVVAADSEYVRSAANLPKGFVKEAVEAGKRAFNDANEYGVRIFCEANLVPVYVDSKATFTYGKINYVSSYFKSVFPEKAGELGLAYNDLDIIYDVRISQADGVSTTAYAAVRFSDIIKNGDGSYTYDLSSPQILSASYFSERVKKNVVDSYMNSYDVERVSP